MPTVCQIGNGCVGTSTAPAYGQLLIGGKGGEYELIASSTLTGFAPVQSVFGRTGAITAQTGDYTTDQVSEGSNLYYTPTRVYGILSATTSLPNITTLSGLSLPYAQLTGTPNLGAYLTLASWYATTTDQLREGITNLYFTNGRAIAALTGQSNALFTNGAGYLTPYAFSTNLSATTSLPNITTLASLSLPTSQLTGTISNGQLANSSITISATSPLTGGGTPALGATATIGIQAASASQNGYLGAGDWSLLHTATTTFSAPLVYTNSTNAVTCPTCNTSSASISSITAGTGLTGGTITTSGTIALSMPVSFANGGTATSTAVNGGVCWNSGGATGFLECDSTLTWTGSKFGISSSTPINQLTVAGASVYAFFDGTNLGVSSNGSSGGGARLTSGTVGSSQPAMTYGGFNSGVAQIGFSSGGNRTLEIGNVSSGRSSNDNILLGFPTANFGSVSTLVGINATTTPGGLLSIAGSDGATIPLVMMSTSTSGGATTTVFEIDGNGAFSAGINVGGFTFDGNKVVSIGPSGVTGSLILTGGALNMTITGAGSGGSGFIQSSSGIAKFDFANKNTGGDALVVAGASNGGSGNDQLEIGTTTATANFQVTNPTANATTTVELGKSGQTKGTCIKVYDETGAPAYLYVQHNGGSPVLSVGATVCASVVGF